MRPKTALRGLQDSNFAGSLQGLCRVPPPAKTLQRPCKTLQSPKRAPRRPQEDPKRAPRWRHNGITSHRSTPHHNIAPKPEFSSSLPSSSANIKQAAAVPDTQTTTTTPTIPSATAPPTPFATRDLPTHWCCHIRLPQGPSRRISHEFPS